MGNKYLYNIEIIETETHYCWKIVQHIGNNAEYIVIANSGEVKYSTKELAFQDACTWLNFLKNEGNDK